MAKRWQICCGIWLGVKSGLLLMPWALAIPEVPLTNTLETDGVNPNDNFRALTLEARTSLAQVNPNRDRVLTEPLPTPLPGDDPPLSAPPVRAPAEADDTVFAVTDIRVVGSTVFDDATLEAIVAPYENRSATLAELQAAANAITQQYLDQGYLTSQAVVGDQTVVDGVATLVVIEGELEDIQVEGSPRLSQYVRDRVALGSDRPLNQARLEDQLRLLRADPLLASVEASLRAGSGPGQSILIVRVTEAERFQGSLTVDNYSPISVGDVRFGFQGEYRSALIPGDSLFTAAYWSDTRGSQVYDLGYRLPINPLGGTVQVRLSPNFFEITDPNQPAFGLNVRGSTDIYDVTYRQPIVRTPREEFALSFGLRHRSGSTLIGNLISDETRTTVLSFGQEYILRDTSGAWALRSQFRRGIPLFNATQRPDPLPDGDFFSWFGQVQRVQVLGPDHLLTFQADLQWANTSLLGSEQFFAGGGQSVRGYAPNQRFGDNGLRFAIEDQITLQRDDAGNPTLRLAPFLEGGYVWYDNPLFQATNNNILLGTGLGVLFDAAPSFSARLDLGYPLIDIREQVTDPPQGLRLYFNLTHRF
jgi:hemolysin activation/secretion protein